MYCVKCGVKLENTQKLCPLCNTKVYYPEIEEERSEPLYPAGKFPKRIHHSKVLNGSLIIMFMIPAVVSFLADFHFDGKIGWFGYVLGALVLLYSTFALPLWFEKPNPVVFTPSVFGGIMIYLQYINYETNGDWFLSFAFPVAFGFGLISTAVVALIYYLRKGKLYIWGGAFILTGAFIMLMEYFMVITFKIRFIGWSMYPFAVLLLLGGLLIYLAINKTARETMERKFFF